MNAHYSKPGPKRRFSIATSWDSGLLDGLARLGQEHEIAFEEVFGAFQQDVVGNARHAYRLPAVSSEDVAAHIATARRLGISYVHLLNAPDLSGQVNDPQWRQQLIRSLEQLVTIGVRTLTIANELLLRFVLQHFRREFRVKLSLIAGVENADRARYFEDLGVDVIALNPFTLNRDFERLLEIRAAVSCELELYANIPCLHACPVWQGHYRSLGRTSVVGKPVTSSADPFLAFCSETFLADPRQLIRGPFIRPEDVDQYFALGINRIKLSDRAEGTAFLLRTATAYATRAFHGNLFELVFRNGSKFRAALGAGHPAAQTPVSVIIDNDQLTAMNFLDRIRSLSGDDLEGFYTAVARRAVRLDESSRRTWLLALREKEKPSVRHSYSVNEEVKA